MNWNPIASPTNTEIKAVIKLLDKSFKQSRTFIPAFGNAGRTEGYTLALSLSTGNIVIGYVLPEEQRSLAVGPIARELRKIQRVLDAHYETRVIAAKLYVTGRKSITVSEGEN